MLEKEKQKLSIIIIRKRKYCVNLIQKFLLKLKELKKIMYIE